MNIYVNPGSAEFFCFAKAEFWFNQENVFQSCFFKLFIYVSYMFEITNEFFK